MINDVPAYTVYECGVPGGNNSMRGSGVSFLTNSYVLTKYYDEVEVDIENILWSRETGNRKVYKIIYT